MVTVLLSVALAICLPLAVIRPFIGFLLWVVLTYMRPQFYAADFIALQPISFGVGMLTILSWMISKEAKRVPQPTYLFICLVALFGWVTLTTFFAVYRSDALAEWVDLMQLAFFALIITSSLITSRFRLDLLLWTICVSLGVHAIWGTIVTITSGATVVLEGPLNSQMTDSNKFALALLIVVPLTHYLWQTSKERYLRTAAIILFISCCLAILGTQSRGGLLGLIGVLALIFSKGRVSRAVIPLALLGLFGVMAVTLLSPEWTARMASIQEYQSDRSLLDRVRSWQFAISVANNSPFFGGGFGIFFENRIRGTDTGRLTAHSIYFQVLGQHGYAGLLIYVSTVVAALVSCRVAFLRLARAGDELVELPRALGYSVIGFSVSGALLSAAFMPLFIHIVALVVLIQTYAMRVSQDASDEHERRPSAEGGQEAPA